MIRISLRECQKAIGARIFGEYDDMPVTGVSTDTRTIRPGDLFFALDGESRLGSDFIGEAFRAGAVAAVSPRAVEAAGPVLVVENAMTALADLAITVRKRLKIPVIAVTGTNGKTTTKDAIAALLGLNFRTVAATGSFNNQIGVPLTICRCDEATEVLVLEVGTNAPGEIKKLGRIARPTIALITCIGPGHLEGLTGLDGVEKEKLSLAETLMDGGWLFLNGDDERLARANVPDKKRLAKIVHFGQSSHCDVRPIDARIDESGVGFKLTPQGPEIHARLRGRPNLVNLLGAVAIARTFDLDERALARGAATIMPAKMRMEMRHVRGMEVTYDCYNANPLSMNAALDEWCGRPSERRRVAVLGDMLELGAETEKYHRALGLRLAGMEIDKVVLVGEAMRFAEEALRESGIGAPRVRRFATVEAARAKVAELTQPGDEVLLKGSRGVGLERLFELPKTQETAGRS